MKIGMISIECFPFVKVGGLGDVVPALSVALADAGHEVVVVIPAFGPVSDTRWGFEPVLMDDDGSPWFPDSAVRTRLPDSHVDVYAIGGRGYFDRPGIYVDPETRAEYADQLDRWAWFMRASLWFLNRVLSDADVVHCHDHHTGLVPAFMEQDFRSHGRFQSTAAVGTIHNLAYQGSFDAELWPRVGLGGGIGPGTSSEYYGRINLMKALILDSDVVTTVSPTYAKEIQTSDFGFGLDGCLRDRAATLVGIVNGIDEKVWNPGEDPLIDAHYTVSDMGGKADNRRGLLRDLGLDPRLHQGPLLGMITRIESQKGFDLLLPILDELLSQDVFFVLLGRGNREIENEAVRIAGLHSDRAAVRLIVDETLAHRLEAAADIFLMPSRYEPCGLNQMYSQRYGTVPIVRRTGGLADTVSEYDAASGTGTGFLFDSAEPEALRLAIDRALALWPQREKWDRLRRNGMTQDFSWRASARRYVDVYQQALRQRGNL